LLPFRSCAINAICELQLISMMIITDHRADPSADLLQAISSKKDDIEFAIGVILLGFGHTEIDH
jgi:hypothetical protein